MRLELSMEILPGSSWQFRAFVGDRSCRSANRKTNQKHVALGQVDLSLKRDWMLLPLLLRSSSFGALPR